MRALNFFFLKFNDNLLTDQAIFRSRSLIFFEKLLFVIRKYLTIITNQNQIIYFNHSFGYDNRFTPALLELYPQEIEKIDEVIGLRNQVNVLDIGANVGQWGYTLKSIYPNLNLYSFEPNQNIFKLLKANSSYFENWQVFNYGVGDKNSASVLFYQPDASAEGSIYAEAALAGRSPDGLLKIPIKLIGLNKKNIRELGLPQKFDVIKIDVEGAEEEVLEMIKSVPCRYLIIEVSVNRTKGMSVEDVKQFIQKKWKKPAKLLFCHQLRDDAPAANAIFSFDD